MSEEDIKEIKRMTREILDTLVALKMGVIEFDPIARDLKLIKRKLGI